MAARIIPLGRFEDSRGCLTAGQYPEELPFHPVRFFVISGVPEGEFRGQHAHRTNLQLLVCLRGGLTARFHDGNDWQDFDFGCSDQALLVPPLHFGELSKFNPGTVLLVLASEVYNRDEYIVDFQEFLGNF